VKLITILKAPGAKRYAVDYKETSRSCLLWLFRLHMYQPAVLLQGVLINQSASSSPEYPVWRPAIPDLPEKFLV
jgi:hypothetical protein